MAFLLKYAVATEIKVGLHLNTMKYEHMPDHNSEQNLVRICLHVYVQCSIEAASLANFIDLSFQDEYNLGGMFVESVTCGLS